NVDLKDNKRSLLSNGLSCDRKSIVVTKTGPLAQTNSIWIDSKEKIYTPRKGDVVVGIITKTKLSQYVLDINAARHGLLPCLSFRGASKRFKPNLDIGDAVYCKVSLADKFLEAELTCISESCKKEWSTGEAYFTNLEGGNLLALTPSLSRKLMSSEKKFALDFMGKYVPYELAIGLNGYVWVNSIDNRKTIIVSNLIECILAEGDSQKNLQMINHLLK
ncbi:Exosome component 3, partial [Bonamia ostreae]